MGRARFGARNGQEQRVAVKPAKRDMEGQGGAPWMIGLTLEPRVSTKLALPAAFCRIGAAK
jgi:hypothetical protein